MPDHADTVVEYMAGLSPAEREALEPLRDLILDTVPDATESMSYKMPTYTLDGQYLAALAAQTHHLSLYFCNVLLVDEYAPQFEQAKLGRGCIRFQRLEQLPLPVVRRILELEARRIHGEKVECVQDAHQYYFPALLKKLGYKPDETVHTIDAPQWFAEGLAAAGVVTVSDRRCDWLHLFCTERRALVQFAAQLDTYTVSRAIWISWPKKSAKVPTEIVEDVLREVLLPTGWVDIKVAAVDQTWSGLKFARRRA